MTKSRILDSKIISFLVTIPSFLRVNIEKAWTYAKCGQAFSYFRIIQ